MSDFRFQPCPGTIAITTLLEFCSWLFYFQKGEGLFDAIFYEIHALVPCGGADDDATPSSASQKRTHPQQLSLTLIVVLRGPHQKNAFFEVDISHFKV